MWRDVVGSRSGLGVRRLFSPVSFPSKLLFIKAPNPHVEILRSKMGNFVSGQQGKYAVPQFIPKEPSESPKREMKDRKESISVSLENKTQILIASQKIMNNFNLVKFADSLARLSSVKESPHGISKDIFIKHVIGNESDVFGDYVWLFFTSFDQSLDLVDRADFVTVAEQIFALITDKEQIQFYVKMFGRGSEFVGMSGFSDFLLSAFTFSTTDVAAEVFHKFPTSDLIQAVVKSCFHLRREMSNYFILNWIVRNLPRLVIPLHKFLTHQLTTGFTRLNSSVSESPQGLCGESCDDFEPILVWLLATALPLKFVSVLEKKEDKAMTTKDLLLHLLGRSSENHCWTSLYKSEDHGLSVNRFQHYLFNYRGPTIVFVYADNGYTFLIASDVEWKESCHFWGTEDALLIQLQPEFHIIERGPKIIYANFSIRGYPFGIQIGSDPRNVQLEIKPDFNYASFKKMPCPINRIVAWGCAPKQIKSAQMEFKKWEAKECEKQRKINLNPDDWNDNPDKYLLELAGNYRSFSTS